MKFVKKILSRFLLSFKKFPLSAVASLIAAIAFVLSVDSADQDEWSYIKIGLTGIYGSLIFALTRLVPDRWQKILEVLGIISLYFYYRYLPQTYEWNYILFSKVIMLDIALFVALLWMPLLGKDVGNVTAWRYVKHLMYAFFNSFFFTLVLILGLNFAIYSIKQLFGVHFSYSLFLKLDIFLAVFFGINYFLSQIPVDLEKIETRLTRFDIFGTKYILTPLMLIYFSILYLYTFKILLDWELPKGIVAWMVLFFSLVALLTYLAWIEFEEVRYKKWHRLIWLAILLQTFMLFLAIGVRIEAYGWTENRYYVALFGLWLFGNALYFLIKNDANIKWIFVTLTLVILFAQFSPLNAYKVGYDSQQRKLKELLIELKRFDTPKDSPLELRYQISDRISYLYNRYGLGGLKEVLPEIVLAYKEQKSTGSMKQSYDFSSFATKRLGFEIVNSWVYRTREQRRNFFVALKDGFDTPRVIDVRDVDYLIYVNSMELRDKKKLNHGISISFSNNLLKVSYKGSSVEIDMKRVVERLRSEFPNVTVEQQKMRIKKRAPTFKMTLELQSIYQAGKDRLVFIGWIYLK